MSSNCERESEFKWISKARKYTRPTFSLVKVAPNEHPLKPLVENIKGKEMTKSDSESSMIDPLSAVSLDPLSKLVAQISMKEKVLNFLSKFLFLLFLYFSKKKLKKTKLS